MDWNSIQNQVSNLTLYDLKAGVRKIQNQVMNYTEMESKVREATNNEPWGASSTLMQEIANGTFNYQLLNEIMPMIYKRFTEKSAEEWRQIYKALQLMEFLVKNGSERVIDDCRSHLSLLKMLRQFHFIDQNGKDQGINVRNRSKELTDLLSDVEKIRTERKKARATRNKYTGVEGGATFGLGGSGSSSRYGGFGSETAGVSAGYGGSTRGVYGDGGGFGGETHDEYDEGGRRGGADRFDEYDEYDDGGATAPTSRRKTETTRSSRATPKKAEPPKPKEPEVDLFEFGDDDPPAAAAPIPAPSNGASSAILSPPASSAAIGDEDDFDDFQSATPSTTAPPPMAKPSIPAPNYNISTATPSSATQFAQPTPQAGTQKADFSNLFSTKSPPMSNTTTPSNMSAFSPPAQSKPTGYQPSGPNYFTSVQVQPGQPQSIGTPGSVTSPTAGGAAAGKKPASGDAFASLLGGGAKKSATPTQKGLTMADMAKQKSQAGLYGAPAAPAAFPQQGNGTKPSTGSSGLDDLLG
ncbi:Epsin-3, clathrin recruitment and traffic between the Golgi and endosome [Saxophila tyrrhenica]|uniref:Epsin-3, clathrin recruitment and traffic between the Golgi and endosome n=1 Tax=Saxophila tyrrhenica TaxID=1690608 RepID=A0AAV9P091_9PEZI|nr:Epsin-3, clathrin recruitment and traffic between the Golgi and endosome [Saxophila tyrrhenica]